MSKEYGSPVDVWSYGCIFAEILKMMDKDASTRSCLFEG
jgi:serine/threonine protein kinase